MELYSLGNQDSKEKIENSKESLPNIADGQKNIQADMSSFKMQYRQKVELKKLPSGVTPDFQSHNRYKEEFKEMEVTFADEDLEQNNYQMINNQKKQDESKSTSRTIGTGR